MVKRLKIKLILFLALFFFPQPLNAGDLTDFLIKDLKIQAGVSQHKLSSDYSYYKNLSEKVFNTEYKDVSTGRFLISWKDFFRYEKEIPLTSESKEVFSEWKHEYYEKDNLWLSIFIRQVLAKFKEAPKIDFFFGFEYDRKKFNGKITVNEEVIDKYPHVYYATVNDDGSVKEMIELDKEKEYSLSEKFEIKKKFVGFKFFVLKFYGGDCEIKNYYPITWYYRYGLFFESLPVVINSFFETKAKFAGVGMVEPKFWGPFYFYAPVIVEGTVAHGQTKAVILKNGYLSPGLLQPQIDGPYYIKGEYHFGFAEGKIFVDLMYSFFRWYFQDVSWGYPGTEFLSKTIHTINVSLGVRF